MLEDDNQKENGIDNNEENEIDDGESDTSEEFQEFLKGEIIFYLRVSGRS